MTTKLPDVVAWLRRKSASKSPIASLALSKSPSEQIERLTADEIVGRTEEELAEVLFSTAELYAGATRSSLLFLHLQREGEERAYELFPLSFDTQTTEADVRQSFGLAVASAATEANKVMLEFARLVAQKNEMELRLSHEMLNRERSHSLALSVQLVAVSKESSEIFLQSDERRAKMAQERAADQNRAFMLRQMEVIVPILASGFARWQGLGSNGDPGRVPEFVMAKQFLASLRPEQFDALGSKLDLTQRAGLMSLLDGSLEPSVVPVQAARLFASVSEAQAKDLMAALDEGPQRQAFAQLLALRENSWDAKAGVLLGAGAVPHQAQGAAK